MKKQIISETKNYEQSTVDELLLDDTPKVNSFNFVTSDGVARAISGASGDVPVVTEGDNGKVLKAIYDEGGPAVEWADAPSGIPDMAGKDGKILGAVDNAGTMEAQWINKPVSNVTTSDKQFVVGVNGTGLPITVDCANADVENRTVSLGTGGYMGLDGVRIPHPSTLYPSVIYPYDLSSIPSGASIQFTVVIPNTIDCSDLNAISFDSHPRIFTYSLDGTHSDSNLATSPDGMVSGKVINAGTYVFTWASHDLITTDTGFALSFPGGGSPEDWATFCGRIESAASTISCSISVASSYTIKPTVIATPGSDAAGKVLTVTDTQGNYGWQPVPQELPTLTGHGGEVLKVNSGATGVEWGTAGSNYTAGDGIAISAQNAISAKVGGGIVIGNASSTSTVTSNLSVAPYLDPNDNKYYASAITVLTSDLVAALNNGPLTVTTLIDFKLRAWSMTTAVDYYPVIAQYSSEWGATYSKYIVFGQTKITNGNTKIASGTSIVYDVTDINTSLSNNLTWAEVEANPSAYVLIALPAFTDGTIHPSRDYYVSDAYTTSSSVNTATASYQGTVTVPNSIILERPVPAYAAGDAGKVLSVNAGGTGVEWATPSGGGGSSSSAFDTTFNLVNATPGDIWRLSNTASYIDLTGGAGVYAYRVVAEITDSSNPTVIDDLYKVSVRIGNASASETKTLYLESNPDDYPEDPTSLSFSASGILNISSAQHVNGNSVYVMIRPAKTSSAAVTTFTGGSVTLYLAKLSTLSGGWQPES